MELKESMEGRQSGGVALQEWWSWEVDSGGAAVKCKEGSGGSVAL